MDGSAGQRELIRRFSVQKFLGKGSYGSVYRVKKISTGETSGTRRASAPALGLPHGKYPQPVVEGALV